MKEDVFKKLRIVISDSKKRDFPPDVLKNGAINPYTECVPDHEPGAMSFFARLNEKGKPFRVEVESITKTQGILCKIIIETRLDNRIFVSVLYNGIEYAFITKSPINNNTTRVRVDISSDEVSIKEIMYAGSFLCQDINEDDKWIGISESVHISNHLAHGEMKIKSSINVSDLSIRMQL